MTRTRTRLAIQTGEVKDSSEIIDIVKASGSLDYCRNKALQETALAREAVLTLPESQYHLRFARLDDF